MPKTEAININMLLSTGFLTKFDIRVEISKLSEPDSSKSMLLGPCLTNLSDFQVTYEGSFFKQVN